VRKSSLLLCLALSAAAQSPQFSARSRLVLVPVTVTDAKGKVIEGLQSEHFQVLDNGVEQQPVVDTIETGVAPIALVIAIQSSGISRPVLDKVEKIGSMIEPLVTGERGCAAVLSFTGRLTWQVRCTNDADAIENALHHIQPGGALQGHMLDAVQESVDYLRIFQGSRRILLLISETKDRGSSIALAKAVMNAQAAGVSVYAATYSAFRTAFTSKSGNEDPGLRDSVTAVPNPDRSMDHNQSNVYDPKLISPQNSVDLVTGIGELMRLHKEDAAQVLAMETGGRKLPFLRQKGLEQAIESLGAELHSQYMISFSPSDPAPGFHHLEIRVKGHSYNVRARPGYWTADSVQ